MSGRLVLRRVALIVTEPLWIWVFAVAALVSCVHSAWVWIRTGVWVTADELPRLRIYKAVDSLESAIRSWGGAAQRVEAVRR